MIRNVVFDPESTLGEFGVLLDCVRYDALMPDGTWAQMNSTGIFPDEWSAKQTAYRHAAIARDKHHRGELGNEGFSDRVAQLA